MLKKAEYKLLNNLEGDKELLDLLEYKTEEEEDIGDAISRIGHEKADVGLAYKKAYEIKEYIEEAVFQGLTGAKSKDFELDNIFYYGHYMYITQLFYNNLREVVWNYAVNYINSLDEELKEEINSFSRAKYNDLKHDLEVSLDSIDNNTCFWNIKEVVGEVLKEYDLEQYVPEEDL